MARQFVDVTQYIKILQSDDPEKLYPLKTRVAVDELRPFVSVLLRNGGRTFDIRPVVDNSQKKPLTITLPVEWKPTLTAKKKPSLIDRFVGTLGAIF